MSKNMLLNENEINLDDDRHISNNNDVTMFENIGLDDINEGFNNFSIDEETNYNIDELLSKLMKCKLLNLKEIIFLCLKSKEIFIKEGNIVTVRAPVTICGDIHGQYYDLLELFDIGGPCPETNYLFMGDYVDRGYYSIEVICLLLCIKTKHPNRIFLTRGNHESRQVTKVILNLI